MILIDILFFISSNDVNVWTPLCLFTIRFGLMKKNVKTKRKNHSMRTDIQDFTKNSLNKRLFLIFFDFHLTYWDGKDRPYKCESGSIQWSSDQIERKSATSTLVRLFPSFSSLNVVNRLKIRSTSKKSKNKFEGLKIRSLSAEEIVYLMSVDLIWSSPKKIGFNLHQLYIELHLAQIWGEMNKIKRCWIDIIIFVSNSHSILWLIDMSDDTMCAPAKKQDFML